MGTLDLKVIAKQFAAHCEEEWRKADPNNEDDILVIPPNSKPLSGGGNLFRMNVTLAIKSTDRGTQFKHEEQISVTIEIVFKQTSEDAIDVSIAQSISPHGTLLAVDDWMGTNVVDSSGRQTRAAFDGIVAVRTHLFRMIGDAKSKARG